MKSSPSNRIVWPDVAKGIAIILVLLGHSGLPVSFRNWIFSFHMPLFFILSGYLSNWENKSCIAFLRSKFYNLFIPFILYSAVVLIFNIDYLSAENFLLKGWGGYALWFIPVLIISQLIAFFIVKIKTRFTRLLIVFTLTLGSAFFSYLKICLPWNMAVVPYSVFLIVLSYCLKPQIEICINNRGFVLPVIFLAITITVSSFWRLDMASNNITPIIPITIAALSGSLFVCQSAFIIVRRYSFLTMILKHIGQETYFIMAMHQLIMLYLHKYLSAHFAVRWLVLCISLLLLILMKNYIKDKIHHDFFSNNSLI